MAYATLPTAGITHCEDCGCVIVNTKMAMTAHTEMCAAWKRYLEYVQGITASP